MEASNASTTGTAESSVPIPLPAQVAPSFYINLTLLNKDEIVANKIQQKTGTGLLGRAAGFVANAAVKEDAVVAKMSEGLIAKLPSAVHDMGIDARMNLCFQRGAYMVFHFTINAVDKATLLRMSKGDEFAERFNTLLECLHFLGVEAALHSIDAKILGKVSEGMQSKLADLLPRKMAEQGVAMDCVVKTPETQADYFFARLAEAV